MSGDEAWRQVAAAIAANEPQRCLQLLAQLDERARAALGRRLPKLRQARLDDMLDGLRGRRRGKPAADPDLQLVERPCFGLVELAACPAVAMTRNIWTVDLAGFDQDLLAAALRLREPDERDACVRQLRDFRVQRRLIRTGLAARPDDANYPLGMLAHHLDPGELLRDDPELLQHEVWRAFELEGNQELSFANHDKYRKGAAWLDVLVQCSEDGRVDRQRLLDACLEALARGFPAYRSQWFVQLHAALAPTDAELRSRADHYRRLLQSPIPGTVAFALQGFAAVQHEAPLGNADFEALSPALLHKSQGTVKLALRLLVQSAAAHPAAAARAMLQALSHPSSAVQTAAAKALVPLLTGVLAAAAGFAAELALVLPALQPTVKRLFAAAMSEQAAADAVPAASALPGAGPVPRPVLDIDCEVLPVEDVCELRRLAGEALEDGEEPLRLERLLDGLLRHGRELLGDRTAGPLRRRAEKVWTADGDGMSWPRRRAAQLLLRTFGDAAKATWESRLEPLQRCVQMVALPATPLPRLSLPTQSRGFVAAAALAARLRQWQQAGVEVDRHDLALALLRLQPDGVEATGLPDILGEPGRLLRFALGARARKAGEPLLWTPARAARDATARNGFGAGPLPRLELQVRRIRHHAVSRAIDGVAQRRNYESKRATMLTPPPRAGSLPLPYTLYIAAVDTAFEARSCGTVRWLQRLWPGNLQWFLAVGADRLVRNLDFATAQWENRAFLEPLLWPGQALGDAGHALLACGLCCKETGEGGLAMDATLAGIADGRIEAARLGHWLGELLGNGLSPCGRPARALAQIAAFGELQAREVRAAVVASLGGTAEGWPRDLHLLLDVLHQQQTAIGGGVDSAPARSFLLAVQPGTQAGRIAAMLLSRD